MADNKVFGDRGERLAERHLKRLGYRILERNYRTPVGELDIVAMDGGTLVFVEVKARRGAGFGAPEMSVNLHKRRQITKAALVYLSKRRGAEVPCRFDVVGIRAAEGGETELTVIKDAFEAAGRY